MQCPACHRAMVGTGSHVIEDVRGVMTISRWRCRPCHETAEEIRLSAGYRGPHPARIRYAVAPQPQRPLSTPGRAVAARSTRLYADAI